MLNKKRFNKDYLVKKNRSLFFLKLAVFILLISSIVTIFLYGQTLISLYTFSKFLFLFSVLGLLIPLNLYQKWFHFIKIEVILFNLMGIGPFLTCLFLSINFFFSSNASIKKYKIEQFKILQNGFSTIGEIKLENNAFFKENKIVQWQEISKGFGDKKKLEITLANGFFGFRVIKNRKMTK